MTTDATGSARADDRSAATDPRRDDARPQRPPLRRRTDDRLVAGVCSGVAQHLGVSPRVVRAVVAILLVNGVGVLAYLALWLLVPAAADAPYRLALHRPGNVVSAVLRALPADHPHRRRTLLGYVLVGCAIGSVLGAFGIGVGGRSGLPFAVAVVGALLIWWRAPEAQRARWSDDARRAGTHLSRRGPLLVMLGGVGLVVVGVTAFLAAHDALAQARAGALAIGATLVGVLLVTGPWLVRLARQISEERRRRIRADERAAVAAHVHDSVLQTLALLQAKAASPDDVRRLARRQERELRDWLYSPGAAPEGGTTFAAALRAAAAEVEDAQGVPVEVVAVGDAPLDEALSATVAAAREAMTNAAKSSGAPVVSVFAEVEARSVEVFVRDRGRGFDPETVPSDRRGIRDSIVGRMARHGGTGVVRSGPAGTEVALSVARRKAPA